MLRAATCRGHSGAWVACSTRRTSHVAGHLEPLSHVLRAECDTPHLFAKSLCELAQPLAMNRTMVLARLSRTVFDVYNIEATTPLSSPQFKVRRRSLTRVAEICLDKPFPQELLFEERETSSVKPYAPEDFPKIKRWATNRTTHRQREHAEGLLALCLGAWRTWWCEPYRCWGRWCWCWRWRWCGCRTDGRIRCWIWCGHGHWRCRPGR